MDDSYKDLNDKKKQLDEYFSKMDDEEQRQTVSRISHRMNNRINRKFGDDSDEEVRERDIYSINSLNEKGMNNHFKLKAYFGGKSKLALES